jgi:hypothetical protein
MMPDPTPSGFAGPEEEAVYDNWSHAKVREAIDAPRPSIPHDQVMAEMRDLLEHKQAG